MKVVDHRLVAKAWRHRAVAPGDSLPDCDGVHLHLEERLFCARDRIQQLTASLETERFTFDPRRTSYQHRLATNCPRRVDELETTLLVILACIEHTCVRECSNVSHLSGAIP